MTSFTGKVGADKATTREDYYRNIDGRGKKAPLHTVPEPYLRSSDDGRWWEHGLCSPGKPYNDLPWLSLDEATVPDIQLMLSVCSRCPSLDACERDMEQHRDWYGVRAGVVFAAESTAQKRAIAVKRIRRKPGERVCAAEGCGRSFIASQASQRYCSNNCRGRESMRRYRQTKSGGEKNREYAASYRAYKKRRVS